MGVLARILLEMDSRELNSRLLSIQQEVYLPAKAQRLVVLRYLVALRQIRIVVILAVELGKLPHLAAAGEHCAKGLLNRLPVGIGQSAGPAETDRADIGIGLRPEPVLAAAEHLRPGVQLDMDLESNYHLIGRVLERIELLFSAHQASPPPPQAFTDGAWRWCSVSDWKALAILSTTSSSIALP